MEQRVLTLNMAAFYYIVRAKLIRHIKGSGEIDFLQFEDKSENENPIVHFRSQKPPLH